MFPLSLITRRISNRLFLIDRSLSLSTKSISIPNASSIRRFSVESNEKEKEIVSDLKAEEKKEANEKNGDDKFKTAKKERPNRLFCKSFLICIFLII